MPAAAHGTHTWELTLACIRNATAAAETGCVRNAASSAPDATARLARPAGYSLSRLPTASDDENPEHPLHRFIKLNMACPTNRELDETNVAGELYAGINPICSRYCADRMMVDLFVSGNGTEDEEYTRACSMIAQDKWNRLTGLVKQLPVLRGWHLRAAHNAHKPDGRGFKRSRDEFERHATREA